MKEFKVGIIGTGFGGLVQAPIFNIHPGFKVQAISSVSGQTEEEIINKTGIKNAYTSWQEMLRQEKLDLVVVSSIPAKHYEMTKEALVTDHHVLCEKPFVTNADDSRQLIQLKKHWNRHGFLDFEWRFQPARQKAKRLIEEGVLGDIIHIDFESSMANYIRLTTKPIGWLADKKSYGGMFGALGSHMVDAVHWLTGSTILQVFGRLKTTIPELRNDSGEIIEKRTTDDLFTIVGETEKGTSFTLQTVTPVRHGLGSSLRIYGTKGTIHIIDDTKLLVGRDDSNLEEIKLELEPIPIAIQNPAIRYYRAFNPFIQAMYEYLTDERKNPDLPLFEDGHRQQLVMDAVFQSVKQGKLTRVLVE
ncbi:predicted dehydrogenase [Bacillus oleivorans]|uniref:Predicted dehydrogenase n=1 Tax=Bacillus oleivorans TaxID=1448271 RepID=A0A285CTS8_9BACI|nr:Gfo/Idh/MocA family oxidoreductase [Bacillus oleivorans]SNX70932.1 predicted dehydrogenase [Bacillus oleivorans]